MSDSPSNELSPALGNALGGVPKALVPSTLKALDRLVGGAIDIPAAWLAQKKAKIDAQTEAFKAVETAIAKAAATEAGADPEIVSRAVEVLVRKSYREQRNREAVAAATVKELAAAKAPGEPKEEPKEPPPPPDEEWLNVFEQYAERASTERTQRLWGRVLAGEIRRPGHYSMRTLRFLSEFSQQDAVKFAEFAQSAFGDCAPMELVKAPEDRDIRPLAHLEAAGLIHGATIAGGLELTLTLSDSGLGVLSEGNLGIILRGEPKSKITDRVAGLTPLGQELLSLVERNKLDVAERVARTFEKQSNLHEAHLGAYLSGQWHTIRVVWSKEAEAQA
jgi:hypothetical protein